MMRSIVTPMTPMMMIDTTTMSILKNFEAAKIMAPRPVVVPVNSAATRVPQQTPSATRIPVKMSGRAFGRIT